MTEVPPYGELSWLLQNLDARVDHVRQTVIEMDDALLFVTAAGEGTCLAVLADGDADAGLVAYEMTVLVKRVGQHLAANSRVPGQQAAR